MHKAPYRNALRSRKMIKDALMQLMQTKGIVKIRTQEVIDLANISKGTFYAHYTCLFDVQQEIEREHLERLFLIFNEDTPERIFEDFFPLFLSGLKEMETDLQSFQILFRPSYGDSFLNRVKQTFVNYMMSCAAKNEYLDNQEVALDYFTYVAGGAIALIQDWLARPNRPPADTVARRLSECALNGVKGLKGS